MSAESNSPEVETISSSPPLPWYVTWRSAVTRPTLETYETIAHDNDVSRNRAYKWLFFSGVAYGIFAILVGLARKYDDPAYSGMGLQTVLSVSGLCISLFISAIVVVEAAIVTTIANFIARRFFGGEGDYAHLLYSVAAYTCPLLFITLALVNLLVPLQIVIGVVLNIFQIYLLILALKAVHRLGWKQSIFTGIIVQGGFWLVTFLLR